MPEDGLEGSVLMKEPQLEPRCLSSDDIRFSSLRTQNAGVSSKQGEKVGGMPASSGRAMWACLQVRRRGAAMVARSVAFSQKSLCNFRVLRNFQFVNFKSDTLAFLQIAGLRVTRC